jgi:signal transduction histidine kinase
VSKLQEDYDMALAAYLREGGEAALKNSYDLGRRALVEGLGVLDMVALHQKAVEKLAGSTPTLELLQRAGQFFIEGMSPYEMTHRAFGESNAALRHVNESLEEETRRIARALHDESGQFLAAVHIELQEAKRGLTPAKRQRLHKVEALLDQIEKQLRSFSHNLRPTVLDDYGLMPALQTFLERFSKRVGLPVAIEGAVETRLPSAVEAALYRVAQEALNNVARHSRATQVNIRIWQTSAALHISIRDNGVGFDPSSANGSHNKSLGLRGMKERLTVLGGTFEIHSRPERGTEIQVSVPMEE